MTEDFAGRFGKDSEYQVLLPELPESPEEFKKITGKNQANLHQSKQG